MIVIGGCHVTGWQIGDNPRFWSSAADSWSGGLPTDCYGPTSLEKSIRLLERSDVNVNSALLILQLGNFEASELSVVRPLIKPILSKLKKSPTNTGAKLPVSRESTLPMLSRESKIKIALKGALLLGLELLAPYVFRKRQVVKLSAKFYRLFNTVHDRNPEKVVVLSTFPTASPLINFYRKQLNCVIKQLAEKKSFTYIDVFNTLKKAESVQRLKSRSLFSDGFHLSALGHSILSDEIHRQLDWSSSELMAADRLPNRHELLPALEPLGGRSSSICGQRWAMYH